VPVVQCLERLVRPVALRRHLERLEPQQRLEHPVAPTPVQLAGGTH
jgi:hypothetical protein